MVIHNATMVCIAVSAVVCFLAMIIAWVMMLGRVKFSQFLLGVVVYAVAMLAESFLDSFALAAGSPFLTQTGLHILYYCFSVAVVYELCRFLGLKLGLASRFTSADAAVGFAIGFAAWELVVGGITNVSNYVMAYNLNANGLEAMLAAAGDESNATLLLLEQIQAKGALAYFFSGLNRVFFLLESVSLSVVVWYAAVPAGKGMYLVLAVLLRAVIQLPFALYDAGVLTSFYAEELATYVLIAAAAILASRLYNRNETERYHFPIEHLRARRRR